MTEKNHKVFEKKGVHFSCGEHATWIEMVISNPFLSDHNSEKLTISERENELQSDKLESSPMVENYKFP